jgi:hypothetical protein
MSGPDPGVVLATMRMGLAGYIGVAAPARLLIAARSSSHAEGVMADLPDVASMSDP